MLEKSGDDLIQRFADELRHIEDDPRWQRIDDAIWLYFREINGIRIGVILATNKIRGSTRSR